MYEDLQRCLSEPDGEYVKYSESKRTQQHIEEAHAKRSKKSVKRLVFVFGVAAVVVFAIIAVVSAVINFNVERPVPLPDFVGMREINAVEAAQKVTSMPTVTYENSSEAEKGFVLSLMHICCTIKKDCAGYNDHGRFWASPYGGDSCYPEIWLY